QLLRRPGFQDGKTCQGESVSASLTASALELESRSRVPGGVKDRCPRKLRPSGRGEACDEPELRLVRTSDGPAEASPLRIRRVSTRTLPCHPRPLPRARKGADLPVWRPK